MADGRLRALVATASLDLGVDWGDVDLVIQMGAPKGASRLTQRIGRANHRLDEPSRALLVPGNRFEYLEARAALDAVESGELDPDIFPPEEGLIAADGHEAAILRHAAEFPLAPARRKALLLKLSRLGADRIHTLMDPAPGEPT